jgi:endothelin-converting enzyme
MGRLYNPDGKLEEWWTNSTSEAFKSHEKCIVDQYAGYYVEDAQGNKVYVNGNLTSGENIGDSGIIQAFRAWKAQYEGSLKDGGEFVLPGLPYTKSVLSLVSLLRRG